MVDCSETRQLEQFAAGGNREPVCFVQGGGGRGIEDHGTRRVAPPSRQFSEAHQCVGRLDEWRRRHKCAASLHGLNDSFGLEGRKGAANRRTTNSHLLRYHPLGRQTTVAGEDTGGYLTSDFVVDPEVERLADSRLSSRHVEHPKSASKSAYWSSLYTGIYGTFAPTMRPWARHREATSLGHRWSGPPRAPRKMVTPERGLDCRSTKLEHRSVSTSPTQRSARVRSADGA